MPNYARIEYVRDWPELTVATNELQARLRAHGRPAAANILVRAYAVLQADMERLAVTMALTATEELRKSERQTRVRPDTLGDGGPRLGDSLRADPMPNQQLLPGSIGIANKDVLDANVPWWPTNEEGSSARVGDVLYGVFYNSGGGDAPPNADDGARRTHALFMPAGYEAGGGSGMIRRPIPARRFIEKAVGVIHREWELAFRAAKLRFDTELSLALATPR